MSDRDLRREHEDTQPLRTPGAPRPPVDHGRPSAEVHRFADGPYEDQHWSTGAPPRPEGPYAGGPDPRHAPLGGGPPTRGPRRLTAWVLVGALVLGGLAGFVGAAGYDLVTPEEEASASAGVRSPVVDRPDTPAAAGSVEEVAGSVLPSVVKINVRGPQGAGSGSGVVISSEGEILTNYHVVEAAEQGGAVSVGFNDGSAVPATVVGSDPLTDVAVIKAEGVSGLAPATLGRSGDLDVGEQVVAIGSPFGLEATVTSGIVSALHRPVSISGQSSSIDTAYPAVQTDAAINPGNSGGPLVNMQGEVVGINSSIRTASSSDGQGGSIGLGFAIPIDEVRPIVDQLRAGEPPTHARLGVSVTDASNDDGMVTGAGIAQVGPGSAAADAGLQRGDIVVKVDDQPVTDAASLVATVRGHRPDDTVTLTVVRDGEELRVEATLDSDEGEPAS